MAIFRMDIGEVFTPRLAKVNPKMYAARPTLEKALSGSMQGSMHALLFGESGNGKSWLYKTVFKASNTPYVVVNCASVVGIKSLSGALLSAVVKPGTSVQVSFSEKKSAGVNAVVADGKVEYSADYEIHTPEPLLRAFTILSKRYAQRRCVVVLENLEAIFSSPTHMEELANAIILLDDEQYSSHNIRFLIVGTPTGVLQYYENSPNLESISNRIRELPKVGSMTKEETSSIVTKGFRTYLKVEISDIDLSALCDRVYFVTMGVAQRIHELCETLAVRLGDSGWRYEGSLVESAEKDWLMMGFRDSYVTVESNLNSRRTEVARRNQVIYAIGRCETHQFDSTKIEALIQTNFPQTIPSSGGMGIGAILAELCNGEKPLLTRSARNNQYRVLDPRFVMCIRLAIQKDQNGKVYRKNFTLS